MFKRLFTILLISLLVVGCTTKTKKAKYNIVTSNYVAYDFISHIIGDNKDFSVKFLLKPGSEMHTYEPTPQDIISIKEADLFVYVGGESDEWIDKISSDINQKKTVKLMDYVDLQKEEIKEGMQEEEEEEGEAYDEHIWTSPKNAVKIMNGLYEKVNAIEENDTFKVNKDSYIKQIQEVDESIREVVKNAKRKTLVFGDRFPLLYFVKEYGLDYRAAFSGCAEETEASAKTISYLVNYVKENHIPVIFQIELSNGKVAKTIQEATNAKIETFYSMHNVTSDDFNNHRSYIDFMKHNIKVLKEAIQ